jgi:ABC-2 type transport system ATP-binding protein
MFGMYDDIVDFAELGKFMGQKLKNYSSGMQVRLAFSIAIRAKSDILLIDEVLAVGDAAFQTKCFDYFYQLKKTDTTVIFVSHDRGSLERFCERGILINDGSIVEAGTMQKVLRSYNDIVLGELDHASEIGSRKTEIHEETEFANIVKVTTRDEAGNTKKKFNFGEKITINFTINAKRKLENPVIGVTIWCKNIDKAVFATNTLIEGIKDTGVFLPGDAIKFSVSTPDLLNDGEYYVEPAIANESTSFFYDKLPKAATFFVNGSNNPNSIIANKKTIKITKG